MAERTGTKPRIALPTPFFDPAYKAGGAAKSILNLVEALSDEFAFDVHCLDHDIDHTPLPLSARIRPFGDGTVQYHRSGELGWRAVRGWLEACNLVYLNGFFAPLFSLKIAAVRRATDVLRARPLLVAPRGEVFAQTLALKAVKKRVGTVAIHHLGLYRDAHWHASTIQERDAIVAMAYRLGQRTPDIHVACDIASVAPTAPDEPRPESGQMRLVFFSRLSPKKNLDFALHVLAKVERSLSLDIIGPIEDPAYWTECQALIAAAPQHRIVYKGSITPAEVVSTLRAYDLFLFPTRSENFGHVIQEALTAGIPALISDQTPWRGLAAAGVGWDLPLDERRFADAIRTFQASSPDERAKMRIAAQRFSQRFGTAAAIEDHRRMLRTVLAGGR